MLLPLFIILFTFLPPVFFNPTSLYPLNFTFSNTSPPPLTSSHPPSSSAFFFSELCFIVFTPIYLYFLLKIPWDLYLQQWEKLKCMEHLSSTNPPSPSPSKHESSSSFTNTLHRNTSLYASFTFTSNTWTLTSILLKVYLFLSLFAPLVGTLWIAYLQSKLKTDWMFIQMIEPLHFLLAASIRPLFHLALTSSSSTSLTPSTSTSTSPSFPPPPPSPSTSSQKSTMTAPTLSSAANPTSTFASTSCNTSPLPCPSCRSIQSIHPEEPSTSASTFTYPSTSSTSSTFSSSSHLKHSKPHTSSHSYQAASPSTTKQTHRPSSYKPASPPTSTNSDPSLLRLLHSLQDQLVVQTQRTNYLFHHLEPELKPTSSTVPDTSPIDSILSPLVSSSTFSSSPFSSSPSLSLPWFLYLFLWILRSFVACCLLPITIPLLCVQFFFRCIKSILKWSLPHTNANRHYFKLQ